MEKEEFKKKVEEIEEDIEALPSQKKKYKSYKKGFTRKYRKFK